MKLSSIPPDKNWQADCDARALAEAEEIKADAKRLKAATTAAKAIAKERAAEVKHLTTVASSTKKSGKK